MWQGPQTWSPRDEVPGPRGGSARDGDVGEEKMEVDSTRREDTARHKLYQQNQMEIELYKREITALAAREDEQVRRLLTCAGVCWRVLTYADVC
jgi:hypothetical protein